MELAITAETKVGAVLEAYPHVEDQLVAWVPAFTKLKNPVLRKTVTKVVTLEQAARIAGVPAGEMIERVRAAAAHDQLVTAPASQGARSLHPPPEWVAEERVRCVIDADYLIAEGIHPLGKTRECVVAAGPDGLVKVRSSFHPAPLIDSFRRTGALVYSVESTPGEFSTYIWGKR